MARPFTVRVPTHRPSYSVHIAPGALDRVGRLARSAGLAPGPCALVSDRTVARHYALRLRRSLVSAGFRPVAVEILPPGERFKTVAAAFDLAESFAVAGLERGRPVFALGGGVVGDLAGFGAAIWMRGVPVVHVPTTVLAQVDSSIGGKVGVDLPQGKNLVGAFHPPALVVSDPITLDTLPRRQVRAGLAEAVKVGFALDAPLVRLLERDAVLLAKGGPQAQAALTRVIERAAKRKARVVSADERESGPRQILNAGHTVGHALELYGRFRKWLHGEAVAIGLEVEARVAVREGVLANRVAERQARLLRALGFPPTRRALAGVSARKVFDLMRLDKKRRGGEQRFVLTRGVGVASFGHPVERAEVIAALQDAGCAP